MGNQKKVLAVLLLFLALGCNKRDSATYHGAIRNNLGEQVHLDFYATANDYNNSTNILKSVVIPPNGQYEVPGDFATGTSLYLDYYTDNYDKSNWGSNAKFNIVDFSHDLDPVLAINAGNISSAKDIWLGGNKPSAVWKLFDYRYNSISYWNLLQNYQRNRQLWLRKDMTGSYLYVDGAGINQTQDFTYQVTANGQDLSSIFVQFNDMPGGFYSITQAFKGTEIYKDTISAASYFPPEQSGPYNMFFYRAAN